MRPARLAALVATLLLLVLATAAQAATTSTTTTTDPNALKAPPSISIPPAGHKLSAQQATAMARAIPKVASVLRNHKGSYPYAYMKGATEWQVSVFGKKGGELAQVTIFDPVGNPTAQVLESWTGYQVAWTMARGYKGAFGRRVNALYVWLPLCALFLLPFLRRGRRQSWLLVDALMLLGFSISLAFFNHGKIGLSVPLAYPFLIYLFVRMLVIARRGERRESWRPLVSPRWLAVMLVFLTAFRVGLNVRDSNVVDIGYAGVIGAHRIVHGTDLYGTWPQDNFFGDTYGPVNYYAYVPFERALGWSGRWDDLPAAHGAAIAFDLLTLLLLFLLGRRIRGPGLGILLAYAWAAYPFTLFVLNTNSNDTLVALTLVATLLLAASPAKRGAMLALSGLAKFVPFVLAPLFLRTPSGIGDPPQRSGRATFLRFAAGFALVTAIVMAPIVFGGELAVFWRHTIERQGDRVAPFSIWGLWGGDWKLLQHALQVCAFGFAIAVGFVPRRRSVVQVAALGAAVLLAFQIGVVYWFYLYVVWFFPFVLVALFGRYGAPVPPEERIVSAEAGRGGHEQLLDPVGA